MFNNEESNNNIINNNNVEESVREINSMNVGNNNKKPQIYPNSKDPKLTEKIVGEFNRYYTRLNKLYSTCNNKQEEVINNTKISHILLYKRILKYFLHKQEVQNDDIQYITTLLAELHNKEYDNQKKSKIINNNNNDTKKRDNQLKRISNNNKNYNKRYSNINNKSSYSRNKKTYNTNNNSELKYLKRQSTNEDNKYSDNSSNNISNFSAKIYKPTYISANTYNDNGKKKESIDDNILNNDVTGQQSIKNNNSNTINYKKDNTNKKNKYNSKMNYLKLNGKRK